jgi:hypothetical protein
MDHRGPITLGFDGARLDGQATAVIASILERNGLVGKFCELAIDLRQRGEE